MGRRSDHSKDELRAMIISEGHRQLSEVGYARFSAREIAKRIGYSIGTLYNMFGTLDQLMLAINANTLDMWQNHLEIRLEDQDKDRLKIAIEAYFEFAILHRHAWAAIYDFRLPDNINMPEYYQTKVKNITDIVVKEVTDSLTHERKNEGAGLARSLLATVHGHCVFTLNGTFELLEEDDPLGVAYKRVQEAIEAS